MPIFDYWAKNVGIRRAHGQFVLVTNPDIVLHPAIFELFADQALDVGYFYRTDRYDFRPAVPPDAAEDQILDLALKGVFVVHRRHASDPAIALPIDANVPIREWPQSYPLTEDRPNEDGRSIDCRDDGTYLWGLHTNASGDFMLASKDAWIRSEGYWERNDTFTHLDSYGVCQMTRLGLRQAILLRPYMVLHADHTRSEQAKRPQRPWDEVYTEMTKIVKEKGPLQLNKPNWGFADLRLPEVSPAELQQAD